MKVPNVQAKNIPECLREIDSWLLWRLAKGQNKDGVEKWLKVPYYANGAKRSGALGTSADRAKLVSFQKAMEVYRGGHFAGVGFATMPEYPVTILDLDSCIDDDGNISKFGQQVLKSGTYVEYSPSGKGLRAVYTGEAICEGRRNSSIASGERVEIYCGSAFVTITGNVVNPENSEPVDLPQNIKRILKPVVESGRSGHLPREDGGEDAIMPIEAAPVPDMTIDHARVIINKLPNTWGQPGSGTWYQVAAALHLQFDGSEEAYELLDEWSQGLDGYDQEANRKRWATGFSHTAGKHTIKTMRNLVFEAKNNGGLKVSDETMEKWGLGKKLRKIDEDDFADLDDIDTGSPATVLPSYEELDNLTDISYMIHNEAPPIEWLVENMIARGSVSFLAGGSGTSKSFFALQLAGAAACGEFTEFAGMKIVEPGFVTLYFAYEDTKNMLHNRLRAIASDLADKADLLNEYKDKLENKEIVDMIAANLLVLPAEVLDSGGWQFATRAKKWDEVVLSGFMDYLREYANREGVDMIVFDTGSEIHSVEENNAPDMVVVMRALRILATSANIGVLVLQHVQKDVWNKQLREINQATIRGSSVLVDKSRNVFMLARMPQIDAPSFGLGDSAEAHERYVVLKHVKSNMGRYVPTKVFDRKAHGLLEYDSAIVQSVNTAVEAAVEKGAVRQQVRQAELNERCEHIRTYISEQNDLGNTPSARMVRFAMAHLMSDDKAREAIGFLQSDGAITSCDNPAYPRSSCLVVTGHKLHDEFGNKDFPPPKAAKPRRGGGGKTH